MWSCEALGSLQTDVASLPTDIASLPKPLTLMCVWLSFQTKEALFTTLRLTFCLNYKRLLHSMAIFRSVSDSTRVLALC